MANRIQIRRDTAANWTSANPTLAQGEEGWETDTGLLKIGDGSTAWASLAYAFENATVPVAAPTGVAATDTANIQNALNRSSSASPKTIVLQGGTYQINAALTMPNAPGTSIVGQGRLATTIQQNTAGVPIIQFTNDLIHTIRIQGMTLQFNGAQTNSGSIGVYYHVTGGTSGGFFHHIYRDLYVQNVYDGFKLEEADGQQCLWDATWDHVDFFTVARSAVRLAPASAIGMPEINFFASGVFATPTVTQSGANAGAFVFNGCEVQMTGIAVEKWNDQAFYISGGTRINIINMHVETHTFTQASSVFCNIQNSSIVEVDGFAISGANASGNTTQVVLFNPSAGSSITLRNGTHNVTTSAGAAYITEVAWAGAGLANCILRVESVTKTGGGLNNPLQGTRGSQVAEYSPHQPSRQYRAVTAAYSHQLYDGVIVVNATAAVTVTLLDPATCKVGVPVTIKNVTANTVTVQSAGTSKTIDGAASTTLAQWAKLTVLSDGTQWLSV